MVALLVRLKLTLLKNSLKRSVWRTIGLVLGAVYGLGLVVFAVVGLVALRWVSEDLTADVTIVVFSALTAGWLFFSLLVFGVDETVDPARFALLPVRARELMPGLLVAGLLGIPGVATVLASVGLVAAWARSVPLVLAALAAVVLGVITCFLLSRAATAAFARILSSRRFRDLAVVVLTVFGVTVGVSANLIGSLADANADQLRGLLSTVATVLAWTPLGWAWALPADVATGRWLDAGLHLVLAAAFLVVLWLVWGKFLAQRLTEPIEVTGGTSAHKTGTRLERLLPATPAGAIAVRTLRYWRRDPRYVAGVIGLVIGPVILMVAMVANPDGSPVLAALSPVLLGMLLGMSIAQDLCYDGSALWQHVSSGVTGRDDRAGRVISTLVVFAPLLVGMLVAAGLLTGKWELFPLVIGLSVMFGLAGIGVGCYVGALWQWPAPPPGANPFQKGNSGGLPALLSFTASSLATLVVGLPTIGLAVGAISIPWLGWLVLLVGALTGVVVLWFGIRLGGAQLDKRWPEVMIAVSEKAS